MPRRGRQRGAWVVAAISLTGCATSPDLDAYVYACAPGDPCWAASDAGSEALPDAPADAGEPVADPGPLDISLHLDATDAASADTPPDVAPRARDGQVELDTRSDAPPDADRELDVRAGDIAGDVTGPPPDVSAPTDAAGADVGGGLDVVEVAAPDAAPDAPVDPCAGVAECSIDGAFQCLQLGNQLQRCVVDGATGCLALVDVEACVDGDPCTKDLCIPAQGACSFPPAPEGTPCPGGQCHAGACDAFLTLEAIDGGEHQTCALRSDGSVWCWGRQTGGIGDGSPTSTEPSPVQVVGFGETTVSGLDVGAAHACAWSDGAGAWCWGHGASGRLGHGTVGDKSFATPVEGLDDVIGVAAGGAHSCAIDGGGAVHCWGANDAGQVGAGVASPGDVKLGPSVVQGLAPASAVVTGSVHTCALIASDGAVSCWGGGEAAPAPVADAAGAPLLGATALAAGHAFTCALVDDGPWCWGALGASSPHAAPLELGPELEASSMAGGGEHACVVGDGLRCLGANDWSQLGDGTQVPAMAAVASTLLAAQPVAVGAGGAHTCVIDTAGAAWCWGLNRRGQLGFGLAGEDAATPSPVTALPDPVAVTVGDAHVCAVSADGVAHCWGDGSGGRLGDGSGEAWPAPVAVDAPGIALSGLSAGASHTCGLDAAGLPWCWGDGDATPAISLGVPALSSLAAGDSFTCGVGAQDGAVHCWGPAEAYDGVVTVDTLPASAVSVAAGQGHACAALDGGALWCWGFNESGQHGNGAVSAAWEAPSAAAITNISTVTCGASHTCAVDGAGGAWCWGAGERGELGDGQGATTPLPVPVTLGDAAVAQPTAGRDHTCVVAAGQLLCWGANDHGELGPAAGAADALTPVAVEGTQMVTSLSAGGDATCMVSGAGLSCWGDNGSGQLGDGSLFRREPVKVLGLP